MADNTKPERKRRGPGRPFAPGVSPNPGGRPKAVKEVVELARQHTPAIIARLAQIVANGDERAAVAAANTLLDRAWGKPTQPISGDNDSDPIRLALSGIRDLIAARLTDDGSGGQAEGQE